VGGMGTSRKCNDMMEFVQYSSRAGHFVDVR
jgi:hypothetical protein